MAFVWLLPGGRWVYGSAVNGATGPLDSMCWDLSTRTSKEPGSSDADSHTNAKVVEPTTWISALYSTPQTGLGSLLLSRRRPDSFQSFQYNAEDKSINHVWYYVNE